MGLYSSAQRARIQQNQKQQIKLQKEQLKLQRQQQVAVAAPRASLVAANRYRVASGHECDLANVQPQFVAQAEGRTTVFVDGDFLVIQRRGLTGNAGKREEWRIPIAQLGGVCVREPITLQVGCVSFVPRGADPSFQESQGRSVQVTLARSDPLSVTYRKGHAASFSALRRHLEERIAEVRQAELSVPRNWTAPPVAPPRQRGDVVLTAERKIGPGSGSGDLAEQLERLAQLHSTGALTDEEFKLGKARLLG